MSKSSYSTLYTSYRRMYTRVLNQYGGDVDELGRAGRLIGKVKNPTPASIKRLQDAIELLKTRSWIKRVLPEDTEPEPEPEIDISDVIIDNFIDIIRSMSSDGWDGSKFQGTSPKPVRDIGRRAKADSSERIEDAVKRAISQVGKQTVAQNIQSNGDFLQSMVEGLVFAIYNGRYAQWGGGRASYEAEMAELEGILTEG